MRWAASWIAIPDTGGRTLITSSEPQNIGFPSTETGTAHFAEMLRTTVRRLTDEDIETLIAALRGPGQ